MKQKALIGLCAITVGIVFSYHSVTYTPHGRIDFPSGVLLRIAHFFSEGRSAFASQPEESTLSIKLPGTHTIADTSKRILLIIMDGARYDYCNSDTMPNLYSFMKEGIVLEKAYAPSSWTLPSHVSLFTGLYPQQHSAFKYPYVPVGNVVGDTRRRFEQKISVDNISIPQEAITLAEVLRAAGYQTLGVFGNPCYGYPIFNLHKGFNTWVNVVEKKLKATTVQNRGFYSFDYEVGGQFYTVIPRAPDVADEVAVVLGAADPSKPIFLFINFEDPIATPLYFPPQERAAVRREYKNHLRESMKKIDKELPPILSFFREGLIIITSDHGQGDGTIFEATAHGTSLHPNQTKIPLLMHNYKLGKVSRTQFVDLTQMMGIILEVAGLEDPNKKICFQHSFPAAFSHLDANPEAPVGKYTLVSMYSEEGALIVTHTPEYLTKHFYHNKTGSMSATDVLLTEKNLSEKIISFTMLERVFPITGTYQKLDKYNIEMLKSLGYIE